MLNSHPKIAAPPECGFLQWWYEDYNTWSAEDARDSERVQSFVSDVLSSRKMETWEISVPVLTNTIKRRMPTTYGELCECVYLAWARRVGSVPSLVIDKNNYYLQHLETLEEVWPDAKYLFIVRDGRDVATSYQKLEDLETDSPYKPDLPTDVVEISKQWTTNNKKVLSFLESIACHRSLYVKYEDMITDTKKYLYEICSFMDLEYNSKMEKFYKHNDEPKETIDWKKKTLEEPDDSRIGKYKQELSGQAIRQFENIAEPMLCRFDYHIKR